MPESAVSEINADETVDAAVVNVKFGSNSFASVGVVSWLTEKETSG